MRKEESLTVSRNRNQIAYGISESDLDISEDTEQVCLKCKQCEVETHMTLKEFLDRHEKEGDLKCRICPGEPPLFFYKVNLERVKKAGFNRERKRQGITKGDMKARLENIRKTFGVNEEERELPPG